MSACLSICWAIIIETQTPSFHPPTKSICKNSLDLLSIKESTFIITHPCQATPRQITTMSRRHAASRRPAVDTTASTDRQLAIVPTDRQLTTLPQRHTATRHTAEDTTASTTPTDNEGPIQAGARNVEEALQRPHQMCKSQRCPLRFQPHCGGIYQHNGIARTRPGEEFHDSNPPPEIWASYMRTKSNMGSYRDRLYVDLFIQNHGFSTADQDHQKFAEYSDSDSD